MRPSTIRHNVFTHFPKIRIVKFVSSRTLLARRAGTAGKREDTLLSFRKCEMFAKIRAARSETRYYSHGNCCACLLELSECKGHPGRTRVQKAQHVVSRMWCLLTRVRVFPRPQSDLLCNRFAASSKRTCSACLVELSECRGHSGGTRVQNAQATVSRTWCLLTRVRVFLRSQSDLLFNRIAASVEALATAWTRYVCSKGQTWAASYYLCLALVQRTDTGNFEKGRFVVLFVWT